MLSLLIWLLRIESSDACLLMDEKVEDIKMELAFFDYFHALNMDIHQLVTTAFILSGPILNFLQSFSSWPVSRGNV